jgi:TonB family protein
MTPDSSRAPLASGVRSLLIGAGAVCAIVAVSVAAASLFRIRPLSALGHPPATAARSAAGLGLRAEVRDGSLQVSWDHEAAPVRKATSGSLAFQDGETRKTLQLSQTTARTGRVFYAARGTHVQVALTIFAPDHVVSESISATVPNAVSQSALSPAGGTGPDVPVPSRDRESALTGPESERPWRATQSSAPARRPALAETDPAAQPVPHAPAAGAGHSAAPGSPQERSTAGADSAAEVGAQDPTSDVPPRTAAVRVQVDETGKVVSAVLVPQKDLDQAFAEAALEMARDWRFEPSPANRFTTRILEFRRPANR